jgi:hypothetical protein
MKTKLKGFSFVVSVVVLGFFLSGCAQSPQTEGEKKKLKTTKNASTPEDAFLTFKNAFAQGEFDKIYEISSKKIKKSMDEEAEKFKKQMEKNKLKSEDAEKLKKYGITIEELENVTGKSLMRVSLVMSQMMMDAFAKMDKKSKKKAPNIMEELKKGAEKLEYTKTEMGEDKKSAVVYFNDEKGKENKVKMAFEDGEWKFDEPFKK